MIVRRRRLLVVISLIALLMAQSAVQLHALRHLRGGSDGPASPGQHSQTCIDCVAHAPLLVMAGGAALVFLVAFQSLGARLPTAVVTPVDRRFHYAVRSRAPPR